MGAEIRITDAAPEHIPQIGALEKRCFSLPWTEELLRTQLRSDRHIFLAALDGETVAGYIGLMYVLDEGYISNVAVLPAYRRRGVGTALLDELEREARKVRLSFLTLEVRASNTAARALYAARGFRETGLRKNYYEKPAEDAVLMTKYL
jgi:ribosomal-protein-alanine N-acetyltransferase